jgi:hypothetical protein
MGAAVIKVDAIEFIPENGGGGRGTPTKHLGREA